MADPDSDMFLRLIQEQLKQSQQGSLQNEHVLQSLNRPSNIQSPFKTDTIPGNAGAFAAPPMSLGTNTSTIPKTSMPQSPMDQFMAMQPPKGQIDQFTRQQDQQNPNISQQTADAPNNMIQMLLKSLLGR